MAGSTAIVKIDVVANATKAVSALKDTAGAADDTKSSWSKMGGAVAGVVSAGAIVAFGKSSVSAAQESAVANARLEQVFRSMGDTTGDAAKAAEDYAGSLSKKIGVDDEAILAAQAQLATFGAVSDVTARQAGVFDRATAAAADLAAAGFGSLDSNAVQLGKALQDPTKGMTALAKSGVTFTDAQKDQIKAMQESGDLLGAQQIVLKAVESQVGGTAAATATSTDKMNVKFGELQEQLGNKLLPIINFVADAFTKYGDILLPLAGIIAGVVVVTQAWALAQSLASAATGVWTAVQAVFNVVMSANPIVLVVLGIAALIAIVIVAYQKVGWFRDLVDAAFSVIVGAFDAFWDVAQAVFRWLAANWPTLLAILTGPIGLAVLLITRNWDTIKDAATAVWQWVVDKWNAIVGGIGAAVGSIIGFMQSVVDWLKKPIDAAKAMYDGVKGQFDNLVGFIEGIVGTIGGIAGRIVGAFKTPINGLIRAWNAIEFSIPGVDVGPIHFGGMTIGTPDIPQLAAGGTVMRTGFALVHEGEQFSGVGRSFGSTTINIQVTAAGLGAEAPEIQRAVVNALRGYTARNGPLDVPVRTLA